MPRDVSLLELKTWARQLSDTENDPNVTDPELGALANRHLTEVYDRLVDAGPADYFAASAQIDVEEGVTEYALEIDFRNLVEVFVVESTMDQRRPLAVMPERARGRYVGPTTSATVIVEYIPVAPVLEDNGDTFDGVSGFEELVANLMARDVMIKRESDPSVVMNNIARLEARITSRARSRDKGGKQVTDMDELRNSPFPWGWTGGTRLACYRLRAGNLEVYEPLWWRP